MYVRVVCKYIILEVAVELEHHETDQDLLWGFYLLRMVWEVSWNLNCLLLQSMVWIKNKLLQSMVWIKNKLFQDSWDATWIELWLDVWGTWQRDKNESLLIVGDGEQPRDYITWIVFAALKGLSRPKVACECVKLLCCGFSDCALMNLRYLLKS